MYYSINIIILYIIHITFVIAVVLYSKHGYGKNKLRQCFHYKTMQHTQCLVVMVQNVLAYGEFCSHVELSRGYCQSTTSSASEIAFR
jgi:hypothetical protein